MVAHGGTMVAHGSTLGGAAAAGLDGAALAELVGREGSAAESAAVAGRLLVRGGGKRAAIAKMGPEQETQTAGVTLSLAGRWCVAGARPEQQVWG
jgi:hypothetical protein